METVLQSFCLQRQKIRIDYTSTAEEAIPLVSILPGMEAHALMVPHPLPSEGPRLMSHLSMEIIKAPQLPQLVTLILSQWMIQIF